jgi:outer membrane receptor protein involved in Fe transport
MTGEAYGNPYQTQQQLYSATLRAKVAGLDFVSVSGYAVNKASGFQDVGTILNPFFNGGYGGPINFHVLDVASQQYNETGKFSQEMRLSASVGKWLDWLVGGFYTHESVPFGNGDYNFYSANPTTETIGSLLINSVQSPYSFNEDAIFSDVTLHFTDQFDLQLGGRESWNNTKYQQTNLGPADPDFYGHPSPDPGPVERSTGQAFTYLITPQFKLSTDAMIYARIATGYRIGGPNQLAPFINAPAEYKPDKTINYEIGFKDELLDRKLSIDASVYYINWHDFQLLVFKGGNPFVTNAGQAKSEGVELEVKSHPIAGLTLTAEGSFNEAELTQDLPLVAQAAGTYGVAGDPLPYSIRRSGGITANQDFPLSNAWTGFVGGQFTYVSSRPTEFQAPPAFTSGAPGPRTTVPSYTTLNLRTGARYDSWLLNLYVNNLADRRSIVGDVGGIFATGVAGGANGHYYGIALQPRTIGVNISRKF